MKLTKTPVQSESLANPEQTSVTERPRILNSARVRILAWVLVPIMLLLASSVGGAWFLLRADQAARLDDHLTREARELQILAEKGVNPRTGQPFSNSAELLELYIQRTVPDVGETMFVVVEGQVIARSTDTPPLRLDSDSDFVSLVSAYTVPAFGNMETTAGSVRYHVVPVASESDRGVLVAAFFVDNTIFQVNQLVLRFAQLSIVFLLLTVLAGWWITGRVLEPVRRLRDTAHQIGDTDLTRRIDISKGYGDEFEALAVEFNDMLDRIEASFAVQKQFVDDAGHELRTPLTIVRGFLDLIERDREQIPTSIPIIKDEVIRMSRLVQDLQTLTRSNQPGFIQLAQANVFDICDELFVKASALADRSWRVSHPSRESFAIIDRQRITQAVLQLCENATRHTKAGDVIELGCRLTPTEVIFFVADAGAGIPEADRDKILQRFTRGSRQDADSAGSGLGLAVVSAIAAGHGGSVQISESEYGGAQVELHIPLTNISLPREEN